MSQSASTSTKVIKIMLMFFVKLSNDQNIPHLTFQLRMTFESLSVNIDAGSIALQNKTKQKQQSSQVISVNRMSFTRVN